MKIVNRQVFLSLPPGTVYAKYAPCNFQELCIKGDSFSDDWFYVSLDAAAIEAEDSGKWADLLLDRGGEELKMDFDTESRDGCFDDDQLFAVLSHDDLTLLISRLMKAWLLPTSTTGATDG